MTYSFVSRKVGLQIKKTGSIKNLRELFLLKTPLRRYRELGVLEIAYSLLLLKTPAFNLFATYKSDLSISDKDLGYLQHCESSKNGVIQVKNKKEINVPFLQGSIPKNLYFCRIICFMEDFSIIQPAVVFRPYVKYYWLLKTAGDMEDKDLLELENTLTSIEEDKLSVPLIEQFLLRRLTRLPEHNLKRVDTAIRLINAGQTEIGLLADAASLNTKQFNRIFSEYIGAHPKEFSCIIRFQRALHLLENDQQISFTSLAYKCNYFDQSHIIKDFKDLSGYTPSEYYAAYPPHSVYFS